MILSADEMAQATGGRLLRGGPPGPVLTDSRRLEAGGWFLALRGERFDGHDFVSHALAAGCAGIIVDTAPVDWPMGLLVVPDTLRALQDIARFARQDLRVPVVGITGTAGKTTTRAMVGEVLKHLGKVHQTQGNLNNQVGVPLTILAADADVDALVLEMGMSERGHIAILQSIGQPTHRIVTMVGAGHTEGTGSVEGTALAKQEMFDGARPGDVCFVNMDNPWTRSMPIPEGVRVVRFGTERGDVRVLHAHVDPVNQCTMVRFETPVGELAVRLPAPGTHLALNAAAAVAVGWTLHIPLEAIGAGLERFEAPGARLRIERHGGLTVINDAYNANPPSMCASLGTLSAFPGRKVALLGDMLELGSEENNGHLEVVRAANAAGCALVGLAGPRFGRVAKAVEGPEAVVAPDSEALAQALQGKLRPGDVVLVKGSRGSKMEKVFSAFSAKED